MSRHERLLTMFEQTESIRFVFPSLSRGNECAYEFDPGHYGNGERGELDDKLLEFQTYGDRTVQHSPAYSVNRGNAADCLLSLAVYLRENTEHIANVGRRLFSPGDALPAMVRAASAVKYDSESPKTRYWCTEYGESFGKTSTSGSKRNLRNWEAVKEWHDGSMNAVYRMIHGDDSYRSVLYCFGKYLAILEIMRNDGGFVSSGCEPEHYFGMVDNLCAGSERMRIRQAYRALVCLVEAERQWSEADCVIGNQMRRIEAENAKNSEGSAA